MKIFELNPDEDNWRHAYGFEARHRWGLPGLKCPACGKTGGEVGIEYPLLELPPGLDPEPYRSGWPVKLERFRELMLPLRPLVGASLPLAPGTDFGPLESTAYGRHGDFTWRLATLLISPRALTRLEKNGIATLVPVPTRLRPKGKAPFLHLELYLEARASVVPEDFPHGTLNPCPTCGWFSVEGSDFDKWGTYRVVRSSLPPHLDLFRLREFPGHILASERFVEASTRLGLTNITFSEVGVA